MMERGERGSEESDDIARWVLLPWHRTFDVDSGSGVVKREMEWQPRWMVVGLAKTKTSALRI